MVTDQQIAIKPLISVIIPCHNTAAYIAEALDSVLAQTCSHFEIIAIDDGSTDETLSILNQYQTKDKRIKVIQQEHTNVTIARTNAIKHAIGDYLFFLDSDDKIAPTFFEKASKLLNENNELSLIYSKTQHFEAQTNEPHSIAHPTILDILETHCLGNGICMMVRKTDYDEVGGLDTSLTYGEDWEFYISMLKHQKKFYQIQEILYFYRKRHNQSSICDDANYQKIARNFLKIYNKHIDLYEQYGFYFHQLFWHGFHFIEEKQAYYNQPLRKWFYKILKPKRYQELCKKYHL